MLLPGLRMRPAHAPDADFVDDVSRAAVAVDPAKARGAITDLFSQAFDFPDQQLSVEGHRFIHRLRSSGFDVREPTTPPVEAVPSVMTQGRGAFTMSVLTAPTAVRAGEAFYVQLRLLNTGDVTLRCEGGSAVQLTVWTRPVARPKWIRLPWKASKASITLLVDVPPGQGLTQPVQVLAANKVGAHEYRVCAAATHEKWLASPAPTMRVNIVPQVGPDPLAVDWPYDETMFDYWDDHTRAAALVASWISDRFGERKGLRVLELGGNALPMLQSPAFALPEARYYNLDVDPFGLVFGTIQRRICGGRAIQDVVGDGMQLPFADGSLDVIVMFATLHHFPDPAGVLRHLRHKLAPGGLIFACCEPVGRVTHEALPAGFRDELLSGICEQAFEPWEWRQLFDQAGLRSVFAQHDRGSLKIALEPV